MKKITLLLLVISISCSKTPKQNSPDFTTKFEKTNGLETTTYTETITYFKQLAAEFPEIDIKEIGTTDSGNPLHLIVFNSTKEFDFAKINKNSKNVILINNAIHPGEPDGVDASMLLLRDIAQNPDKIKTLENIVLAVIPIYNIGGALNRSTHSRANQNGPKEYGFRGNTRNFDLNRDFIKADTKNARAFAEVFHLVNPDVFIDNHVSNGADYQYAITHLFTQHNKLGNDLGLFLETTMRPVIEADLLKKDIIITPYVNVWGTTPEAGFSQFFDSPRYSTGYTSLFNSLGFMVETHMLKPYKQRVEQTYSLLESAIDFTIKNSSKIKKLRKNAVAKILAKKTYPITFEIAKDTFTTLQFKGYEGSYIDSKITNGKRLFYDRTKPYTKPVKYYNNYKVTKEITIPKAYILNQGWWKVIERLNENNIAYTVFKNDTIITAEEQYIADYKTRTTAYEGHYLHYNTTVSTSTKEIKFNKGAIYIPVNQFGARYIIETLEASATDSFFNWNYFDSVLQQKEGYSAYVFEDIAEQFLKDNPDVKKELVKKIATDVDFAKNTRAQLDFIYKKSPYYEAAHLKLPIHKVF
ncbi:M14 family metallopeptidase [Lutibacter sp. A64]|uniref:M14 family metallopeptidase n=1 Tax=Lutibacter sp. A64 TaxID=2918526 RepID=UPI001F05A005|nr:M14 family metallopeptidase [Lutibacter sp. A64]UMB53993.1 M14 family metallopeptidase [Lutibacter sp. A64]